MKCSDSHGSAFFHESAVIEPGADIGVRTRIWHHSHIRAGAEIGMDCTLGKNVFIDLGVHVGHRVKIQNNVSVYSGVYLADDVFVGPSAVFTNDLRPRAFAGDWTTIRTHVCRGVSIGANATIICGADIGEYAMVGAGAVVTAAVRPHQLVAGNPARHRGWVCACGEVISRDEIAPADLRCSRCRKAPEREKLPSGPAPGQLRRIPMAKVLIGIAEQEAVLSVLRSGGLANGPHVAELERLFAEVHRAKHAVAVSNGTIALVAALRAHGITEGDEVITTPLTFVATLNAILETGATVRFADVGDDLTMDPAAVEPLISPRTAAIIPVHLYGLPSRMREILVIARRHGLLVIEDAAQAHGAEVDSSPVGSTGTASFSFYATKNITCGEGGIVTTQDDTVAAQLRLLRNHGMTARYDYALPGHNYRLTDVQAALAVSQLKKLSSLNAARRRNAVHLSAGLAGLPGLTLPAARPGTLHAWHQYTVRVCPPAVMDRDQLQRHLDGQGIDSTVYYPRLVHDYACYRDHPQIVRDHTPRAGRAVGEVLSLPVHPALAAPDVQRVISAVRSGLAR